LGLKWRIDDIAFDVLPAIIWKLLGVIHARLTATTDDVGPLLGKYDWCIAVAKSLPAHHSGNPAALRLVAEGRVPKSISEADRVLKTSVSTIDALDKAILNQFGLPLWPLFTATRQDGKVDLSNDGIGSALAARIQTENDSNGDSEPAAFDLRPGDSVSLQLPSDHAAVDMHFSKLGRTYRVTVPIADEDSPPVVLRDHRNLPATIDRKRLSAQREYRKAIDPEGIVIGSSPAMLEIFERIHHANLTDGLPAVLLLGEPGVGKTHIAALIHKSSNRASKPFEVVNAGGGGGDINIQRGEWIGYGKNHGIQHIDKNGHPGHLMKAQGGSLFIDEFASFSPELQAIFLSVLERRAVQKVGGESLNPDVRCILATNADLDTAVSTGSIRRDLLDRIPEAIRIPPLRERRGDVLLLARRFAGEQSVTDRCLIALLRYEWPGNVRELQLKMASAIAKMKADKTAAIDIAHCEIPEQIVSVADALDEEACRRELWTLADEIARHEGFEHGTGLQRRAGEIMGVREAQASKMYQAYDLAQVASA
jgi:DNA-binding NtrC family response regulator